MLFRHRCLERPLLAAPLALAPFPADDSGPPPTEAASVEGLIAQTRDLPAYGPSAANPGNREAHYRGPAAGATLVAFVAASAAAAGRAAALEGAPSPEAAAAGGNSGDSGGKGYSDAAAAQLLAAVRRLRERVEASPGLRGAYRWFDDDSLHVRSG